MHIVELISTKFSLFIRSTSQGEESSTENIKAITNDAQSSSTHDPAQSQASGTNMSGGSPHDSDKQERIERYVRMSISNQVEQQLLTQQNRQVCRKHYANMTVCTIQTETLGLSFLHVW